MHNFKLILRNVTKDGIDIFLPHGENVIVGRNRLCQIKNSRLSRHHLRLSADYQSRSASVTRIGGNASIVCGTELVKGAPRLMAIGDKIELLEGEYAYVLAMVDDSESERRQNGGATGGSKRAEPISPPTPKPAPIIPHTNHWSQGLLAAMSDPSLQLYEDDRVVIIDDRYPKARHHFLVLPRERIVDLASVTSSHIPLLEHMSEKARDRVEENFPGVEFRFGYHAVPSMSQLHLHAISQDFDSPCLKHKKHWNSFNTEYFIPAEQVMEDLKENGEVNLPQDDVGRALLKKDLKCHKCDYVPKHLPDLKNHIKKKHFPTL